MAFLKSKQFWGGVAVGILILWLYQTKFKGMGPKGGGA
jgi:hypothetical protein